MEEALVVEAPFCDKTGQLIVYADDCSIDDMASLAPVIFKQADEGDGSFI